MHSWTAAMDEALRGAIDAWTEAIVRRDRAAADRLMDEAYVLTSAAGVGDVDRATWLGTLELIDTRTLEHGELETAILGDVAVVAGRWQWDASLPDRDLSGEYAITDVFVRSGDGWRARWRISTRLPE
jgi:hypothetical protein